MNATVAPPVPPQASALPARTAASPFVTSRSLPPFAWAVLVYNIAVILWGAIVRATSSGAGCGDHWPLCNGVALPVNPKLATVIEFTHRSMSGLSLIAVVVLAAWVFWKTVPRHLARTAAIAAVVLTFNEALLGALIVLLKHVAKDQSLGRAVYLSLHLANTLLLLAALTLTAHFLSRHSGALRGSIRGVRMPIAAAGLAATIVVGVSGSLAALGDTLFPTASLRSALMQDFSGSSQWLIRLRLLHPASAFVAGAFIIWLVSRAVFTVPESSNRRLATSLVVLLFIQFGLGFLDVALRAPVWMQVIHLLGADLFWTVLVVLAARVCLPPKTPATALP